MKDGRKIEITDKRKYAMHRNSSRNVNIQKGENGVKKQSKISQLFFFV